MDAGRPPASPCPESGAVDDGEGAPARVIDIDGDGINDLVAPDHEGYLALYRQVVRDSRRVLLPGERIFREQVLSGQDKLLRVTDRVAGRSGRRTFTFADWNGDGKPDILLNGINAEFFRNVSEKTGEWKFRNEGPLDGLKLAGHNTAPTTVDWDQNGIPDLLIGGEDGFFYYVQNPRSREGSSNQALSGNGSR